ncbi:MAG: prolipoprotein diacylglyceryl transferase [Bacteroidales bacterium]
MYPRISDLLNDLLGTNIILPVQTYGFFVAMAFVAAGSILYLELKRKERNGTIKSRTKKVLAGKPPSLNEYITTALLYFAIGYKIIGLLLNYGEVAEQPQEYLLSWKGNFLAGVLLAALAVYLVYRKGKKEKLDKPVVKEEEIHPYQLTPAIVLVAAFAGIFGAKMFDVVEHLDDFFRDPLGTLFSFSGLTFYGGLIVAAFAVSWYGEKNNIRWPVMADAVAPALMLAYAVGRIGCQLSGDGCWGVPNPHPQPEWLGFLPNWTWSFTYPHNVINEGVPMPGCDGNFCHELAQPVWPTPFYETTICTIFFFVLWGIRKSIAIPGVLFSIYLILNGIERFFIEFIRVNIQYTILGIRMTQAQAIAILIVVVGIAGIFWFRYRYHQRKKLHHESTT